MLKRASLRCGACGRERMLRMRERGATVVCDGCGAMIDVPQNLAFPEYPEIADDQITAERLGRCMWISFFLCCIPVSAGAWWIGSGAIQRAEEEGRPVDPVLRLARDRNRLLACVQMALWLASALMSRRF